MIKNYEWRDLRNVVGWAAACARLALPFYDGNRRDDVVAAIEITERCARGVEVDYDDARAAGDAVYAAASVNSVAGAAGFSAATTAGEAVFAAAYNTTSHASHAVVPAASTAANAAVCAGVPQLEIDQAQFSAIASDLGLATKTAPYYAAIAALAIGNIGLAREIAAAPAENSSEAENAS